MDGGTAVQIGDIKDFWKIAKEEEIFFWHFIQEKQCDAAVKIIFASVSLQKLSIHSKLKSSNLIQKMRQNFWWS